MKKKRNLFGTGLIHETERDFKKLLILKIIMFKEYVDLIQTDIDDE